MGSVRRRLPTCVLLAIVAVFVVLATVIAVRTPPWEADDEPAHVLNVETLVSGHWYRMSPGSGLEAHQAPLYYLALAGWQRVVGLGARRPNPGPGVGFVPSRRGVYLSHSHRDLRFLLRLRLPNVFFGVVTILLTYAAARLLTGDVWTPVVAAAVVAATPVFVFKSAFVNNDNLANTFRALLALTAVAYLRRPSAWRMAAAGASAGLLVATKLSTFPLVLVLVTLVVCTTGATRRLRFASIAVAATFATCGWYLMQNAVRYGDPLARAASASSGSARRLPWSPCSRRWS